MSIRYASEYTLQLLANLITADGLFSVKDFHCAIAGGTLEDKEQGGVIGQSTNIVAGSFKILSNIAPAQPASEMQMEVVSTSGDDTAAGSGAQQIRIKYLPEAWSTEFSYTYVELDGDTPVDTSVSNIYRIEDFSVTRGNPAVGTITLKDTGAVTTYAQIDQYTTFFQRCIHYVRTGYQCYVLDTIVGCSTNGGVIWRLFRTKQYDSNIVTRGRLSAETADDNLGHSWDMPIVCPNPDGLRMAVGIAAQGPVAAQSGTATIRYYDELIV